MKNGCSNTRDSSLSILVIDDDVRLCGLIAKFFSKHELSVDSVHDGASGLATAILGKHDLILLNAILPVLDGLQVLRQVRLHSAIPVILLTSRRAPQMFIAGLDAGADDFISKPFRQYELLARVRAVMRRAREASLAGAGSIIVSDVLLNPRTREVRKSNIPVNVTSFEFDVLDMLMRSAGRVVSRDELAIALYRRQAKPSERALDVHVSHLRKKLESNNRTPIRTVWGIGYLFARETER